MSASMKKTISEDDLRNQERAHLHRVPDWHRGSLWDVTGLSAILVDLRFHPKTVIGPDIEHLANIQARSVQRLSRS
jgi:hypothetical protein